MRRDEAFWSVLERVVGADFEVVVVRSARRRTATLQVVDGGVVLRVPVGASRCWIETLVAQKTRWIREKLDVQVSHRPPVRRYANGETFDFLGTSHVLSIESNAPPGVRRHGDELLVGVPARVREHAPYVRRSLVRWYRRQALAWLSARSTHYAAKIGREPSSVSVRTYRSRWGSCDSRGHVRFNWLAIAAPPAVVDYLVVHELCHLAHMDHSPTFWRAVERVLPDYAERRNWLKLHGPRLSV